MSKINIEASMLLISTTWQDEPSFKMIPVSESCPYVECLFDPGSKTFVIISKTIKTSFHMMPKLDDMGDPTVLKTGKRPNGKVIKEQRVSLDTFQEHYVADMEDAKAIIKIFAVNEADFDYGTIVDKPAIKAKTPSALIS